MKVYERAVIGSVFNLILRSAGVAVVVYIICKALVHFGII